MHACVIAVVEDAFCVYSGGAVEQPPCMGLHQFVHGALIIADEVQPGFSRTGAHVWGASAMGSSPIW